MKKKKSTVTVLVALLPLLMFCSGIGQASDRDAWQQPKKIMDVVGVQPGMVIGEAGAGRGYFTFFLAERVGETGKVYANDIDASALKSIERQCERDSIDNIVTIRGEENDPLFPQGELDMVIMMRAFHHFANPEEWMKNVTPGMKPNAPLVIIDQDSDKTGRGHYHFMTKEEVLESMQDTPFELERIETFLEQDNIYVYKLKNDE